ncbi:MAG TPA: endonuclease/exonuclease/phosphatase family protein [Galbitalea sp.]
MIRRLLVAILVVVAAAILWIAVWPQTFGLQNQPYIAQAISLRGLDVAIAVGLLLLFLIAAFIVRPFRRAFLAITALLLVFCLISLAILGSRGFGDTATTATKSTSDITVLSWNTKGGMPGAYEIAQLALAQHADIVSLPETTQLTGDIVSNIMKSHGRPMWVYSAAHGYIYQSHATTLLISSALGKYKVDTSLGDTSLLASIVARPVSGSGPTIVAVHAVSPKPDELFNWRSDLKFLSKLCAGPSLVMAGDFNSTLDELNSLSTKPGSDFGQCTDAGHASHSAAIGTWPTSLPALLGAQIDHVMYTSEWRVVAMHVIRTEDNAGSDHRPIVTTLAPAGP